LSEHVTLYAVSHAKIALSAELAKRDELIFWTPRF